MSAFHISLVGRGLPISVCCRELGRTNTLEKMGTRSILAETLQGRLELTCCPHRARCYPLKERQVHVNSEYESCLDFLSIEIYRRSAFYEKFPGWYVLTASLQSGESRLNDDGKEFAVSDLWHNPAKNGMPRLSCQKNPCPLQSRHVRKSWKLHGKKGRHIHQDFWRSNEECMVFLSSQK